MAFRLFNLFLGTDIYLSLFFDNLSTNINNYYDYDQIYLKKSLISSQAGDTIGILKKSTGSLHFLINGQDQGEAASNLPSNVYGAVDIYGAAVKVSIISAPHIEQEQDSGQLISKYSDF